MLVEFIYIGPYLIVLMNHIEMIINRLPVFEHGLTREHTRRERDRHNWIIAQEMTYINVQKCLQRIINGTDDGMMPDHSIKGTLAFITVIWHYVEIFCSPTVPLISETNILSFPVP